MFLTCLLATLLIFAPSLLKVKKIPLLDMYTVKNGTGLKQFKQIGTKLSSSLLFRTISQQLNGTQNNFLLFILQLPSQSAPTILIYQVNLIFFQGLELLKNLGPCFLQKAGCKKTGSLLFKKRKDQAASSLFE